MKKILIAEDVKTILDKERSFLGRAGVKLFTAGTNDEILMVHQAEKVNLIIAPLDVPGMKSEDLYAAIRDNQELRSVSVITLCPNTEEALERCMRCGTNAVMTLPVDAARLLEKAQQLLDISWRESYRVLISVNIEGDARDTAFFCRSENISTSGILLETDKVLAKGNRVSCSFFLPGSKQIKTTGEIVRVMKPAARSKVNRYGVKFAPLAAEATVAIETFIERKSQISTSRK